MGASGSGVAVLLLFLGVFMPTPLFLLCFDLPLACFAAC
jgi:hypothetical protein